MENRSISEYTFYQGDDTTYYFITDDGRRYSVAFELQPFFEDSDFLFAERTYEVFLTMQKSGPPYNTDPKIGATFTAIVRSFTKKDPFRLVFFTCDTADKRHLARYKRLNAWLRDYNQGNYLKLEDSISYPVIHKLFLITLLLRNDNSYGGDVLAAFVRLNAHLRTQK
ncbi:DUF6169 family protein [Spirosoma gilvum]